MLIQDLKVVLESLNTGFQVYYGGVPAEANEGIAIRELGGEGILGNMEKPIIVFIVESMDYFTCSTVSQQIYNYIASINNLAIPYGTIIRTNNVNYPMCGNDIGKCSMGINAQLVVQRN